MILGAKQLWRPAKGFSSLVAVPVLSSWGLGGGADVAKGLILLPGRAAKTSLEPPGQKSEKSFHPRSGRQISARANVHGQPASVCDFELQFWLDILTHQNRTIAIASDFRVDGAKSPEIPQNEGAWAQKSQPEIANRSELQ